MYRKVMFNTSKHLWWLIFWVFFIMSRHKPVTWSCKNDFSSSCVEHATRCEVADASGPSRKTLRAASQSHSKMGSPECPWFLHGGRTAEGLCELEAHQRACIDWRCLDFTRHFDSVTWLRMHSQSTGHSIPAGVRFTLLWGGAETNLLWATWLFWLDTVSLWFVWVRFGSRSVNEPEIGAVSVCIPTVCFVESKLIDANCLHMPYWLLWAWVQPRKSEVQRWKPSMGGWTWGLSSTPKSCAQRWKVLWSGRTVTNL